jgi:hypothetical protein
MPSRDLTVRVVDGETMIFGNPEVDRGLLRWSLSPTMYVKVEEFWRG